MRKYIKTVTVTGASDDTSFEDMAAIQARFPFVEWGILHSERMAGKSNRFPTDKWLINSINFSEDTFRLNLSVHLCGNVVKTFLTKPFVEINKSISKEDYEFFDRFVMLSIILDNKVVNRVQINTHGEKHKYDIDAIESYLNFAPHVEFIAQYDGVNDYIHKLYDRGHTNISALYDLSHGAGVLPEDWDEPLDGIFTGYAGGLSPDNLEEQLKKLDDVASIRHIWIDAETWLRTNDQFDLDKVVKFLEIAESRII
jgi:phosphoribosylanthranilate isomerase